MTDLHCTVDECAHYCDNRCCIGGIEVVGSQACSCGETLCASFDQKTGGASEDVAPAYTASIGCDATHCLYNDNTRCTAESITIEGCDSSTSEGTRCGSFMRR